MKLKLTALLAVLALTGCITEPIQGRAEPYPSNQINFADNDLRNMTAVGAPQVSRDSDGQLLYVSIPIRAATNKQLYVDYRVTFVDRAGIVVNQTGWFTKTLTPNVFDQLSVNSTSPRAADFRVDLRWAK